MENRNYILAIALSLGILVAWQYLYVGPQMEAERERLEGAADPGARRGWRTGHRGRFRTDHRRVRRDDPRPAHQPQPGGRRRLQRPGAHRNAQHSPGPSIWKAGGSTISTSTDTAKRWTRTPTPSSCSRHRARPTPSSPSSAGRRAPADRRACPPPPPCGRWRATGR